MLNSQFVCLTEAINHISAFVKIFEWATHTITKFFLKYGLDYELFDSFSNWLFGHSLYDVV